MGAKRAAVTFEGSHYVIVTAIGRRARGVTSNRSIREPFRALAVLEYV